MKIYSKLFLLEDLNIVNKINLNLSLVYVAIKTNKLFVVWFEIILILSLLKKRYSITIVFLEKCDKSSAV